MKLLLESGNVGAPRSCKGLWGLAQFQKYRHMRLWFLKSTCDGYHHKEHWNKVWILGKFWHGLVFITLGSCEYHIANFSPPIFFLMQNANLFWNWNLSLLGITIDSEDYKVISEKLAMAILGENILDIYMKCDVWSLSDTVGESKSTMTCPPVRGLVPCFLNS